MSIMFMVNYKHLNAGSFYLLVSTRCIYLDLVLDCSSSSCVHVLKRFLTARGVPMLIISDNGSQFNLMKFSRLSTVEVLNGSLIYPVQCPLLGWHV